jgi:paraquat-inducible protein B
VSVRLSRSAADIARQGSEFWIVRIQSGALANLGAAVGTVFSGPYIQVLPGSGAPTRQFVGLDEPPVVQERGALHIVLRAANVAAISVGTPVIYRGVQVGAVQNFQFNSAATAVEIHVLIRPQFARLVHSNSRFRTVGGINAHFGLFKGLQLNVPPLKTLVTGGIVFSTPESPKAAPARNGAAFDLDGGAAQPAAAARGNRASARADGVSG